MVELDPVTNNERNKRGLIPGVSRWYRYDWQYAADLNRFPFVQEAALIISITPVLVSFSNIVLPKFGTTEAVTLPLWLLWGAAVAFVSARVLYYFACPKFIREYRDFGQYSLRQHSHRWIVWEFYHNLESLFGWQQIVKEVSPKGLTIDIGELPRELSQRLSEEFGDTSGEGICIRKPVNIDRDIYLPIYADGKKLALAMRESDPDLAKKEKELFWILSSQAAKERPILRATYWVLIWVALILVSASALRKVYLVLKYLMCVPMAPDF